MRPLFIGASTILLQFLLSEPSWSAIPMRQSMQVTAAQLFKFAEAASAAGDQANAERAYRALIEDPSQEVRLEARNA